MFYGIQFPPDENGSLGGGGSDGSDSLLLPRVLTSREEVFKLLKVHKKARFKCFESEELAENFANSWKDPNLENHDKDQEEEAAKKKPEEGCGYSGLTPQQLKCLKEAISQGQKEVVDQLSESLQPLM